MANDFIAYMNEIEELWIRYAAHAWRREDIAFNVINAALSLLKMSYDEALVQIDIHGIRWVNDSSFIHTCLDYTSKFLTSRLRYFPVNYAIRYIKALNSFEDPLKNIQSEDAMSSTMHHLLTR